MIDRSGRILRVTELLDKTVFRCGSPDTDGSSTQRTYRKADGDTYDEVRKNEKDRWEWSWPPSGPGKKRTGILRPCNETEIATEEARLKRNRDALETTALGLQRWVPELTDPQALSLAKKPRFMRTDERQKLASLKDAGEFMTWLLGPTQ